MSAGAPFTVTATITVETTDRGSVTVSHELVDPHVGPGSSESNYVIAGAIRSVTDAASRAYNVDGVTL